MGSDTIQFPPKYTLEELSSYTKEFNNRNLIGVTQYGKLYRGKISHGIEAIEVTVKLWFEPTLLYPCFSGDNERRLIDEIILLQEQEVKHHPSLVKLIGYCEEEGQLGVVYDLKSLDTVHNLVPKGDFEWLHRIKVAIKFACFLEFLHAQNPPYMLRNISAAHIMLDQDHNPKLLDFSMISGGVFPDRTKVPTQYLGGCYGYIDPYKSGAAFWSLECDVFSFGVLLLGLITKKVYEMGEEYIYDEDEIYVHGWAKQVYKPKKKMFGLCRSKCSLVHQSLEAAPGFFRSDGYKITKLAMQCVESFPSERPTMDQIVKDLLKLRVVQHHAGVLGIEEILHGHDANAQKACCLGT